MEGGTVVGLLFVIVVAAVLYFAVEGRDARLKQEAAAPKPPRCIAVIEGQSKLTGGGQWCAFLLVVSVAILMLAYAGATTIFQQIQAGVAMIAAILLFGLGVALLRKHTYQVFETQPAVSAEPPIKGAPVPAKPEEPLHRWTRWPE
jgi:hypothetical protein